MLRKNYFSHEYALDDREINCKHSLVSLFCCCFSDRYLEKRLIERYMRLKHLLEMIYLYNLPGVSNHTVKSIPLHFPFTSPDF